MTRVLRSLSRRAFIPRPDESRSVPLLDTLEPRRLLAAVLHVDGNAPGPVHDGAGWSTAYRDLQQALAAATSGDVIRVADGTWKPTNGTNREISFVLKNGVTLLGGYAGFGAANPDTRDVAALVSVLSGDIGIVGQNNDNSYSVVTGSVVGPSAVLDGFTITSGNANGPFLGQNTGGGVYIDGGSPTLRNCTFRNNSSKSGGGGLYVKSSGGPLIENCLFLENSTAAAGGGMESYNGQPTLRNCSFRKNSAVSGGGLSNRYQAGGVVENCTFTENAATVYGGAMYNAGTYPLNVTGNTFVGNTSQRYGGAIYNSASPYVASVGNRFLRNAGVYGGAMANLLSSLTSLNDTFHGNNADQGGAIYNYNDSSPRLVNDLLVGNIAQKGGGIYNNATSTTLTNCTLAANTAASSGPDLHNLDSPSTVAFNSVLWSSPAPIAIVGTGSTAALYSNIRGGWAGVGNVNADPRFLRDPGPGPDNTWGTADDDVGDLRPRLGSPMIDSGNNAYLPPGIATDLAGKPRVVDLPTIRDPGAIVDMGAFERVLIPGDMNDDGVVNNQDIAGFLLGLTDPQAFLAAHGYPAWLSGDMNGDGVLDERDIAPFVDQLVTARASLNGGASASSTRKALFHDVPVQATADQGGSLAMLLGLIAPVAPATFA